jgi:hypothetical protein
MYYEKPNKKFGRKEKKNNSVNSKRNCQEKNDTKFRVIKRKNKAE